MKICIDIQQRVACTTWFYATCPIQKRGVGSVLSVPYAVYLVFFISPVIIHTFGRMSFLSAVPCACFVLQPLHPWMAHTCASTCLAKPSEC